jgi:hypothetical protein
MRRAALTGFCARARSGVRPLNQPTGIMPPVPLWRFSPFRAPAAFDVNLCTDSVLPGIIVPVRLRCAWVLWPLLSCIPCKFWLLEYRMGPFPALVSQRHSSILTGLIASLAGFALPSRAFISCRRPGNSPAESPGDHRRRPIASALFRRRSWDFAKNFALRASLVTKACTQTPRRDCVLPEPPYALRVILIHEAAHADVHHDTQRQKRKQDRRSSIAH